jgi:AcrR family transcriptional regulator
VSEQRERILSSACEMYLQDGLDGFSMRKLARVLGVTAPALYRHYESRERVLLDVVREAYRTMIEYLHRALNGRTPEDRFRLAGEGFLDFALQHPRYYEVLFMGVELLAVEAVQAETAEQGCAVGQFWNDRVREAVDAGLLAEADPEAVGMTLWAHAHGLVSLYLKGMLAMDEDAFRRLVKSSSARVMNGLGTRAFAARLAEPNTTQAGTARSTMEVG